MPSKPSLRFVVMKEAGTVSLKMLRKQLIFLLSLAMGNSFTAKRCGSQLRATSCPPSLPRHPSTYMSRPLYELFKDKKSGTCLTVLLVATQVTTITALLLVQTGWITTDF